ncbi:MAG: hypothetical protein E7Z87_02355 [Cyanobacteria bacterium SIG26]|nr:hypothetical protein [Cyanobacteria bacterium SIG26]
MQESIDDEIERMGAPGNRGYEKWELNNIKNLRNIYYNLKNIMKNMDSDLELDFRYTPCLVFPKGHGETFFKDKRTGMEKQIFSGSIGEFVGSPKEYFATINSIMNMNHPSNNNINIHVEMFNELLRKINPHNAKDIKMLKRATRLD